MGKPIPATQAAAPFSPESERLRVQETKHQTSAAASTSAWSLGTKGTTALASSGDSLDNPNSPQYQSQGKKQDYIPGASAKKQETQNNTTPGSSGLPNRFSFGWDKLLVTQKTICNKAMNLLLNMEAPQRYFSILRTKTSATKHSGIILDYRSDDEKVITQQREAKEGKIPKAG
jgi:hypothetical protein